MNFWDLSNSFPLEFSMGFKGAALTIELGTDLVLGATLATGRTTPNLRGEGVRGIKGPGGLALIIEAWTG